MSIQTICQRYVDTIEPGANAAQAAERMHQRTVGALVVVNSDEVPVGILTDRDLAIRVVAAGRDAFTTAVREVMTPEPVTAPENVSTKAALSLMQAGEFRRLPIVDSQGHLAGLVALDDILMLVSEEFALIGRVIKRETPQAAAEAL